jgi:hypothetical protein
VKVPGWAWLVYLLLGLSLEALALANHVGGDTATEVILRTFPGWLLFMGIGWLIFHFRKAR